MEKEKWHEIMELVRTSLQNDDTDDYVLIIGMDKFMKLCEAYIRMRELLKE